VYDTVVQVRPLAQPRARGTDRRFFRSMIFHLVSHLLHHTNARIAGSLGLGQRSHIHKPPISRHHIPTRHTDFQYENAAQGPLTLGRMPLRTNKMQGDQLARTVARTRVCMAVLHVVRAMTMAVPECDVVSDQHVTGLRESNGPPRVRLALHPIAAFRVARNQPAPGEQDLPPRACQLSRILPPRELLSQLVRPLMMYNPGKQALQNAKPPIQRDFPSYHVNLPMKALALYIRPT
jgi:hypothetical protein